MSITRDDLRHAAGSAGFDTTFPLLVRRLIAETAADLRELDMPGGSGTAAGGFDGVVTTGQVSSFVPLGTSVWELSVGGGQTKANDDYEKRIVGPDGVSAKDITYVQAILVPWTKARTWQNQRSGEGRWKKVIAYNLDSIHAWLEFAPATEAWLAEQLGKSMPGVRPVEAWWEDTWLPSTSVPLDSNVVLAGRKSAASNFLTRMSAGEGMTTLGGELRTEEAQAFVAACLDFDASPEAVTLRARTLFVSNAESLARLARQPQPLILLLSHASLAAELPQKHPHQLVAVALPGVQGDVEVPPLDGEEVEAQLTTATLPRDRAQSFGTLARRSLLALRRAIALNPVTLTPTWAMAPDIIRRRLLLIGAWDGNSSEDRRIVEQCLARPYSDIQESALLLAAAPEMPFIARVEESWHVLSPEDAWTMVGAALTRDDIDAFRVAVLEVFGELDPSLDLDSKERWKAGLLNVRRKFSGTLRTALAQSLALISATGAVMSAPGNLKGTQWVQVVVSSLFRQCNEDGSYRLWGSLRDVLPLLAEAAPDAFLQAMSQGLVGDEPLHAKMFQDNGRDEFGNIQDSPHTSFLWALEALAWSNEYFDHATEILSRLASLDPGGEWANRPSESLVGIFNFIYPNTSASLEDRMRCLERIKQEQPVVANELMLALVDRGSSLHLVHSGPRYRDWKKAPGITNQERASALDTVAGLLLDNLNDDPERYISFIDKLDIVSNSHRERFGQSLAVLGQKITDKASLAKVFEAIRSKIADHREYGSAEWTLPEEQLQSLLQAAETIRPVEPVTANAWLFESDWVVLGDRSTHDDPKAHQATLARMRNEAIALILDEGGLDAVATLAAKTAFPRSVGTALASHTTALDNEMIDWLGLGATPKVDVALAYLAQRLRAQEGLLDALLTATGDLHVQSKVLNELDDPTLAWERLDQLSGEVRENYWKEFRYWGLGLTFEHVLAVAASLIEVGRNAAAIDFLMLYSKEIDTVEGADVAAKAAEALLAEGLDDPEFKRLRRYTFKSLFALLASHRDTVGRQRVVHIEWQFFPILGFDPKVPTLHAALSEDPAFFAELVSYTYRRDDADEENDTRLTDLSEDRRRALARHAFDVLNSWRRCPAATTEGVDEGELREWVKGARDNLASVGRLGPGDEHIGQVMAYAAADTDGVFPPRAVRAIVQEVGSERLDAGLRRGLYNKRGVSSRGMMDGGIQEWELVKSWRENAQNSTEWPRIKRILGDLAESYERDAHMLDQEAERRRRGLGD
ncbi:hypothetical protein Asphe3_34680 [Pseudarthrobacter phenanthrenivorans Sphe3]|uniref:Uncharacterized protein n=2 Tax=Pseudarthrobacter phenanthrenivorans TaxID=361575 RepID=F0M4M3_PSEPM|nr:hypothetical protein Asphe3_34680 [Pseudarthrobacter phenanthrenivorans Sphe3]